MGEGLPSRYVMHLAVFGGTGFLGRQICKAAASKGWSVSSVSRSLPSQADEVVPGVDYVSADIFHPKQYEPLVQQADAVVHSIGSFMDDPRYKQLVKEPLTPFTLLGLAKSRLLGSNPMANSFQRLNRDSAVMLADVAAQAAKNRTEKLPFVYISAENWNKMADPEYIMSKREAEHEIACLRDLRSVLIRPGFLYDADASRQCWPSVRSLMNDAMSVQDQLGGESSRISTQSVADAVIDAIEDPEVSGVVSNEALREFQKML